MNGCTLEKESVDETLFAFSHTGMDANVTRSIVKEMLNGQCTTSLFFLSYHYCHRSMYLIDLRQWMPLTVRKLPSHWR